MKKENRLRCLLVEDEAFGQIIGRTVIEQFGDLVDVADTGQKALELVSNNAYHFIFLDLGLPDMSGIDVAKALRETYALKTPIIAVTAYSAENKKNECITNGFDEFLEKPFTASKYLAVVNKFLRVNKIDVV